MSVSAAKGQPLIGALCGHIIKEEDDLRCLKDETPFGSQNNVQYFKGRNTAVSFKKDVPRVLIYCQILPPPTALGETVMIQALVQAISQIRRHKHAAVIKLELIF